jgi:hypothetical protein
MYMERYYILCVKNRIILSVLYKHSIYVEVKRDDGHRIETAHIALLLPLFLELKYTVKK